MKSTELISFILSFIGALAWLPSIIKLLKLQKVYGKIISRYDNYNDISGMILFKLSLLLKNKPFSIKEIQCLIETEDNQQFSDIARNMRQVTFNLNKRLLILGKDFINNFSIIPNDENIEGYMIFLFDGMKKDVKFKKTTFILKSFDGTEKKIIFNENEIDSKQLFYDDSIWGIS